MLWLGSTRGRRKQDAELLFQLALADVGEPHRTNTSGRDAADRRVPAFTKS
jgi:hypothetical protein